MRKIIAVAGIMIVCGMGMSADVATPLPTVSDDGAIRLEGKSIQLTSSNRLILTLDYAIDFNSLTVFAMPGGDTNSFSGLRNHRFTRDGGKLTCISDMIYPLKPADLLGTFTSTLELLSDGRIKASMRCDFKPGKEAKNAYTLLHTTEEFTGNVIQGNKTTPIENRDLSYKFHPDPDLSATFFPELPAQKFNIVPTIFSKFSVIRRTKTFTIAFKENMAEFIVDLR